MYDHGPERKIITGTMPAFYWCAPGPVADPALTFEMLAGPVVPAPDLARVRASDTVDGISGVRKLTKVAADIPAGTLTGPRWGAAILRTAADGDIAITVQRITPEALYLAKDLPHAVLIDAGNPATIEWLWWKAVAPAAVTAAATGYNPIPWSVTYTATTAAGDIEEQTANGIVHVVDRIFLPPVTEATVERLIAPGLLGQAPRGQLDRQPQIDAALGEIVLFLRSRLEVIGRREDDLDGTAFAPAVARLAASITIEAQAPDAAQRMRDQAFALVEQALASVSWYRPMGVTQGATAQMTQSTPTITGGSFGEVPECPF